MSAPAIYTLIVRRGHVIHPYPEGESYGDGQEVRMTAEQARPYLAGGQVTPAEGLPVELEDLRETVDAFAVEDRGSAEEVADDDA